MTLTADPVRYVKLAPKMIIELGALAATDTVHHHVPDGHTGTSCAACFGWYDDPRHLVPRLRHGRPRRPR